MRQPLCFTLSEQDLRCRITDSLQEHIYLILCRKVVCVCEYYDKYVTCEEETTVNVSVVVEPSLIVVDVTIEDNVTFCTGECVIVAAGEGTL